MELHSTFVNLPTWIEELPSRLARWGRAAGRKLRPRRSWRLGLFGARVGMLVLFVGFTLTLTAAFVYTVNRVLLPDSAEAIHSVARNRCIVLYRPETKGWKECLKEEPPPPSEDARPFLETGAWFSAAGLGLTLLAARGRLATVIPAVVLAGLVIVGATEARREVGRERERIDRIRTSPTPPVAEAPT